jgi:HEAT repeat protein
MIAGRKDLLARVAAEDDSPELRRQAVEMLGVLGAVDELSALYEREPSTEIKEAMLNAFMMAEDKQRLLEAARDEPSPELRGTAIQLLGVLGAGDELWSMMQAESDTDLRVTIAEALFIAGESERMAELARTDRDTRVRELAVMHLGMSSDARSADLLLSIYETESEQEVREAVLNALMIRNDAATLIRIARDETDPELKRQAVQLLAVMGSDESTEFMKELLESD